MTIERNCMLLLMHDMTWKEKKAPLDRSHRCYLLVAYFFKGRKGRDIDNILKYTQDALSKKIFKDDSCML